MAWYDEIDEAPLGTKLQAGLGAGQLLAGSFLKKGKRPEYGIPGGVQEAVATARMQANATTRPGNEYAIDQIRKSEGRAINNVNRASNSATQVLAAATGINANTNRALSDNANQNTMFRFNAQSRLQDTLMRLGQYQEKQWYENQMKPYMDRVQTKNMLTGAGIQNISGAANTLSEMSMFEKVFGNGTSGNTDIIKPMDTSGMKSMVPAGTFKFNPKLGGFGTNWQDRKWNSEMSAWPSFNWRR
jgi:hypothetical protein